MIRVGSIHYTTISWNTVIYEFVEYARAIYGGYSCPYTLKTLGKVLLVKLKLVNI